MRIRQVLSASLMTFAVGVCPLAAQQSLQGSWTIVENWGHDTEAGEWRNENVQPSLYIFLDGHYSIAKVNGDQARPLVAEDATRASLTAEQAASVWLLYTSNSGTYETTSSTLTTHPTVALWPNFMEGGSETFTFEVEGDELLLSQTGEGFSWNARLRRLR